MKMYFQGHIQVNESNFSIEMPLEQFEEETGIIIDKDEKVDDFTDNEIADFVISQFEEDRYNMGIEADDTIYYIGFDIYPEGHEDLVSSHRD